MIFSRKNIMTLQTFSRHFLYINLKYFLRNYFRNQPLKTLILHNTGPLVHMLITFQAIPAKLRWHTRHLTIYYPYYNLMSLCTKLVSPSVTYAQSIGQSVQLVSKREVVQIYLTSLFRKFEEKNCELRNMGQKGIKEL